MTGALRAISSQFRVLGVFVGCAAQQCAADSGGVLMSETCAIILDAQY